MSAFQAVNTTLPVPDQPAGRPGEETTPTTPRPNTTFFPDTKPQADARAEDPSAKTPTRNSFVGLTAHQPLPSSQDTDMGLDEDGPEGSDPENPSGDAEDTPPSKKVKGQRFWCQKFPPCQLSFTRSEHLARHIRKHTGERPFQCHCGRRFSRLDNLRQHSTTVHQNEPIPNDSLAATGTRFQRQIRTERVRPAGNRSRANTLGSQGGHSRGHSRNLSGSSIVSTASSMSVSQAQDVRRRPPTLAMANDGAARARLSLNTIDPYNPPLMGSPGPQIVDYSAQSAGTATTPTSATFSTATESPNGQYGSGYHSPTSTASRPVSWAGSSTPGRRLSVPSGANPYSSSPGQALQSYMPQSQSHLPSSTSSVFSNQNGMLSSPTGSNFSESRRDSNGDADWRRRTWHPGTYTGPGTYPGHGTYTGPGNYSGPRPATSGLGYHQTPDAPRSSYTSQPAASQFRLPGIESFDLPPPPLSRRPTSPMQLDRSAVRPLTYHAPSDLSSMVRHEKRPSITWDTLKYIDRLEISSLDSPQHHPQNHTQNQWSHGNIGQVSATRVRPTTAPHPHPHPSHMRHRSIQEASPSQVHRNSQDAPVTPRKNKREGWYGAPISQPVEQPRRALQRTSPEDSSSSEGVPTPSNTTMTEYHPAIVHSNGYVEAHPPGPPAEENKPAPPTSIMNRPHPIHYNQYSQSHNHSSSYSGYQAQREPDRAFFTFGQSSLPRLEVNDTTALDTLAAVANSKQQAVGHRSSGV